MRILQAADRPGWAIDRLAKPLAEMNDNVDILYINNRVERFIATGYTKYDPDKQFTLEEANKYDLVHFHHLNHLKYFNLRKGIKKVATIHTEREADLEGRDLEGYDALICPTKKTLEYVEKRGKRGFWIPHCIELDKFVNPFNHGDDKTVGYVGRIVEWKRFDVILKAVYEANLKLLGCGYIEDKEVFNRAGLRNGKDFEFNIFVPDNEIVNFYSRMNLLVCLSRDGIEAGPLPTLEAMALGIPVLSTPIGWARDNAKHNENIFFIEENNIKNLSSIIKSIYDNIESRKRIADNARKLIINYGMDTYSRKLMEVYEKI